MTLTARGFAVSAVVLGGLAVAVPVVVLPDAQSSRATTTRPVEVAPAAQVAPVTPPRASAGSDPALLIGVGVAALAGAGGLFAAAQYTARRA